MVRRTKAAATGAAVALALVLSACGGSSDAGSAPEKKPPEEKPDGSVDLDTEDGTVKYDDGKGNQTELNIDGTGASLPDDWPKALAPPDSITITTTSTSADTGMTVIGETDEATDDVAAAIKAQATDAGFDVGQETSNDTAGDAYSGFTAEKGDEVLTVSVASFSGGTGKTTLSMTLKGAG